MALTEEEVKALEKEADLTRRRNIAAANLKDARGTAGMQRAYNQMRAESDLAAHERFMERRRAFAERNPLAIPGEERRRLQLQEDRGSLRAHEMSMLDKRNANSLAIAKENRGAAREQGYDAAYAKAQADIKLGEINRGIKEKEFELARQKLAHEKELEALKGKNTIDAINTQNKGSETVEKIRGESSIKTAAERAKGDIAREEIKRDMKNNEIAARIERDRINNGQKVNRIALKEQLDLISSSIAESMKQGKTYEEAVHEIRDANKNNPDLIKTLMDFTADNERQKNGSGPQEGDERPIQGGVAVYRNGVWVKKQ